MISGAGDSPRRGLVLLELVLSDGKGSVLCLSHFPAPWAPGGSVVQHEVAGVRSSRVPVVSAEAVHRNCSEVFTRLAQGFQKTGQAPRAQHANTPALC